MTRRSTERDSSYPWERLANTLRLIRRTAWSDSPNRLEGLTVPLRETRRTLERDSPYPWERLTVPLRETRRTPERDSPNPSEWLADPLRETRRSPGVRSHAVKSYCHSDVATEWNDKQPYEPAITAASYAVWDASRLAELQKDTPPHLAKSVDTLKPSRSREAVRTARRPSRPSCSGNWVSNGLIPLSASPGGLDTGM